jgi:hypothetical protein
MASEILKFEDYNIELLARGGSFDITGTSAVINKQFWGFNASDGAVLDTIKGVPVSTTTKYANLAAIRSAEVDISGVILTGATDALFGGVIYRADGYIITYLKLTSGSLHCYKRVNQISA